MLGRSNCCAPQKTCYNNTYDDYEESSDKGKGRNGFNACRPSFKENLCNRIKRVQESSKILENVLDIASTLVKIMCVCGIHECKANKALDVIIYAFMHFDEVAEHPGGKCKKRIRKEEFYNDLMRDCGMTKAEAILTYSIVKCAFKAFYHKQVINRYDGGFVDECEWKNAANRTINAFAQAGASKSELELTGRRILCAYENYMCRLQSKKAGKAEQDDNKCVCKGNRRGSAAHNGGKYPHGSGGNGFDPCNPCSPPEPPLYGELCCQLVCPPGSQCPQIVCKDSCGRTFLRVDGNKVNFDPYIMECEAKRAAMSVCPPCDADRIRAIQECLNICRPKDIDSCDEKLEEICRNVDDDDICDDKDICSDMYESGDDEGSNGDGSDDEGSKGDGNEGDRNKDDRNKGDRNKGDRNKGDRNKDDRNGKKGDNSNVGGGGGKDRKKKIIESEEDIGDNESIPDEKTTTNRGRGKPEGGNRDSDDAKVTNRSKTKSGSRTKNAFSGNAIISITVKFDEERSGGRRMEVDMQGYCPDDGNAPDDIRTLIIKSNRNSPLEFSCTPLDDNNDDTKSARSAKTSSKKKSVPSPKDSENTIKGGGATKAPRHSKDETKPEENEAGTEEAAAVVGEDEA